MYRSSKNVCIRNLVEIRTSLAENANNTFQNICPIGYKFRKLYSSYLVAIDRLRLTSWRPCWRYIKTENIYVDRLNHEEP